MVGQKARILIAEESSVLPQTALALSGYDLITCTKLHEAERMVLEDGIDLFVIGLHFDESQGIQLIHFVKATAEHAKTPIILIRWNPAQHPSLVRATVAAVEKFGFVDHYLELENDERAIATLRSAADALLPVEKLITPNSR